ncbi:PREDICTED: uncharacterized protein LOC106816763 isoform X2 [Priapulus caudatus]|uniref:Uncharacterized protein LOC106816763 isoform X2 n=1 Tax=Priapulus caudatus TaxID=37621 RepID=A0ABM1EXF4_PRICU|nr:PREDICTED: uncharacterized protein LOC106816763 isoform X2 [Priapulus caudatus]
MQGWASSCPTSLRGKPRNEKREGGSKRVWSVDGAHLIRTITRSTSILKINRRNLLSIPVLKTRKITARQANELILTTCQMRGKHLIACESLESLQSTATGSMSRMKFKTKMVCQSARKAA